MPANVLASRIGVFVKLAESVRGTLGRTSLMKLCFFLQTLRDVPLHYDFSLYSYGPFDSELLSDLQTAENICVLETNIQHYPGGYRYHIKPGEESDRAKEIASEVLAKYHGDIHWVAETFGNKSASDLELLSTIVFINEQGVRNREQLCKEVKSVKPHFAEWQITRQIDWLISERLLN